MAKTSKYPKEFRNQKARECYELILKNKTTVAKFAAENNIDRKNPWSWLNSRYYKSESGMTSSSFVKIEKAPVSVVIDYFGAKIQTNGDNLAYVLGAIKTAETI